MEEPYAANNIELDVKVKCIEAKIKQKQLGKDIGTSRVRIFPS